MVNAIARCMDPYSPAKIFCKHQKKVLVANQKIRKMIPVTQTKEPTMTNIDLKIALRIVLDHFGATITDAALSFKAVLLFDDVFSADEIAIAIQEVRQEWASCQN